MARPFVLKRSGLSALTGSVEQNPAEVICAGTTSVPAINLASSATPDPCIRKRMGVIESKEAEVQVKVESPVLHLFHLCMWMICRQGSKVLCQLPYRAPLTAANATFKDETFGSSLYSGR